MNLSNSASIIIGLVFIIVASLLAYFFSPKGENQTYANYVSFPALTFQQGFDLLTTWVQRLA